jgi:glyoxylase-like metal-dependent hydrolase (beta-lactamase superfamily II)
MKDQSFVTEMSVRELVRQVEDREEIHVLDVRAPARLESGRIDILPPERFHNIRGSEVLGLRDPAESGLPRDALVAVVCGRGNDSRVVADHLKAHGFRSVSVAGGMVGWMRLVIPRELATPPGCDRFVQFDRIGKGALGYVLISQGQALVIDPPRDTSEYLELVKRDGAQVVGVADTHAHADYVSGGPTLARTLGVPYYLHPEDSVYPYDGTPGRVAFTEVTEGAEIAVGRLRVIVEHTPGHTSGSVCYRIGDHAVLTGDLIFVDSVGRPDLGGKTAEWTAQLWRSLERARSEWPSGIRIAPAHYASDSERNEDRSVGETLDELQKSNPPLMIASRERFTEWVMSQAGSFPDAYRRIKGVNVGLEVLGEDELDTLEAGRNQCALG